MARMANPPHPGELLREDYLIPLRVTQQEFADHLGVSRKTVSALVNERVSVSPEMAIRLSRALDTTPEFWLNLQQSYDLWYLEKDKRLRRIKKIEGSEAA